MYCTREDVYWALRLEGASIDEAAGFSGFLPGCDRLSNLEIRLFRRLNEDYVREHPEECPHGIAPPRVRWESKCRVKRTRPLYA